MSYWIRYLSQVKLIALTMKVLNIRVWHSSLLSLILGGVIGCTPLNYLGLAQPPVIPIKDLIQRKNTQPEGIYIRGRVVDRAPFMDSGSYKLRDESGTIWVLTNGQLPQTGDEIIIKGQVEYQAIPLGGQDLGELYIVEVEKLGQDSQTVSQPVQTVNQPIQPIQSVSSPQAKPTTELNVDDLLLPHKRNVK
ncbi:DNA-binding protein [Aphanothece sacrum]|uniref:DNA-binding protein n=1 Tax=Aphanothece sacrum FPU1 TaxID=1920663 RepID=A0A401IK75_APHSA|nr:DNA-binding protein [Aphanothece sacrum]GBF81659.1 DNA-binding protein [Aphanothece sacrum FPU1]GBF84082.1 DNA-binding protein [Aphanothece sacrum FPU3]